MITQNIVTIPAGVYTMKITATVGNMSEFFTIDLSIVDPCSRVILTLDPTPFTDQEYVLRSIAME